MIEDHIHCAQCQHPIATTIIASGGKRKPVEVKGGMQLRAIPAEGGRTVSFIPTTVPLCDECAAAVEQAQEESKSRSRIVVPGAPSPAQVAALKLSGKPGA